MHLLRHSLAAVAFALFAVSPAHAKYKKSSPPPLIATCIPSKADGFALPMELDDISQLYQKTGIRACIDPNNKIPNITLSDLQNFACGLNNSFENGQTDKVPPKWTVITYWMDGTKIYHTIWKEEEQQNDARDNKQATEKEITIRFERPPVLPCNRTFT